MRTFRRPGDHGYLSEIQNEYFFWLCDLVGISLKRPLPHERVARILHGTTFSYFIPNDDNRAEDGKNLRQLFAKEKRYENVELQLSGECSLLEMLIGLAIRMEYIIEKPETRNGVSKWFWEMLRNLRLDQYTDLGWTNMDEGEVRDIITTLMTRKYKPNGEGGLFPLQNKSRNQIKNELWYQMQDYISENYE